jgi:two-component system response regulator MprA
MPMPPRLLLVDDDPAVLSSLRRALAHEGYAVLTADDGEHAATLVAGWRPVLIVLDVGVAGVDRLLRRRGYLTAPQLLLTTRAPLLSSAATETLGADGWLVKPFALDELLGRVRTLVQQAVAALEDKGH